MQRHFGIWCVIFALLVRFLKNNLAYALFFLLLAIGYSVVISVEPALSLKEMNKPILNGLLSFSIAFPIVLYKETPTAIAKDGDGVIRHGVIGDYGKGVGAVLFGISAKYFAFTKSQLA